MNLLSPHGRIARLIRKHAEGYQNANVSDGGPRARRCATLPSVDLAKFLTTLHVLWQKIVAILRGNPLPYDEAFKATRRPSIKVLVMHLIPIAAVFVITSLNLYGYWIGKELSGVNNQNAPKELALQLTAKAHELLILASVSEIVLTHLLKSLACGYGLPFGSLTAGSKFKDLSYIWSRDFRAMWAVGYPRKSLLLPLILLCLALSIVAGPSSATALIPRLAEWPSGKAVMTLNTTEDALWPSRLEGGISSSSSSSTSCDKSTLGCFNPLTWDSIGSALFSYWGHDTTGGSPALPQHINVPGVSSLRSMDTKLRISAGSLDPPYTLATVQHAVTGDMVNTFRFLTFPSRSKKCGKRWAGAMCSYQDVKWYAKTMQPLVLSTCMETGLNTTRIAFPSLQPKTFVLTTRYIDIQNVTFGDDERHPQFRWVSSTNQEMSDTSASIDVVVKLPATTFGVRGGFACTIQAQWSKSTTFTSFTGTDNLVSSTVSGMKSSMLDAKQYKSQPVLSIASEWAQRVVDSRLNSQSNDTRTAFESFMQLGEVDANPEGKIEMALSVLFAETMAHTSSGTAPLSISSKSLSQGEWGFECRAAAESRVANIDITDDSRRQAGRTDEVYAVNLHGRLWLWTVHRVGTILVHDDFNRRVVRVCACGPGPSGVSLRVPRIVHRVVERG